MDGPAHASPQFSPHFRLIDFLRIPRAAFCTCPRRIDVNAKLQTEVLDALAVSLYIKCTYLFSAY